MMRLYKHNGSNTREYLPSGQTHCTTQSVEAWMLDGADATGAIHNVSVDIHGTIVAVADAAEVRVVAALYAADHNDYVSLNLCYNMETSPAIDVATITDYDMEHDMELWKLEDNYEQNETLTVNTFGPSNSRHNDW